MSPLVSGSQMTSARAALAAIARSSCREGFDNAHLSDRIGLSVVAELRSGRAVGGIGSHNLGGVAGGSAIVGGSDGGREGKDGDRELHGDW